MARRPADELAQRLERRMEELRRERQYGELMVACGIPDRFQLSHELGDIADDCAERGDPLLVAVGVLKETGTPSGGFYEKAEEHAGFSGNTDEDERLRWWFNYLRQMHAYWKQHSGEGSG